MQPILLAMHLFGVVLWIGGAVTAALTVVWAEPASQAAAAATARRVALRLVTPGMALAWLGGLLVLIPDFGEVYARQGWMHGKLTLLLVAAALTGVITGRLRRAAGADSGGSVKAGGLRGLAFALLGCAAVVLGLVFLRP